MAGFLLDTNAINRGLDQNIEPATITSRGDVFVTHIQIDELQATRRPDRQEALLDALQKIDPTKVPTSAAVWDVSRWNESEWSKPDGVFGPLLYALNARNGSKPNNTQDALIGATAIARGLVLVTNDVDLADEVRKFGGEAISFESFVA